MFMGNVWRDLFKCDSVKLRMSTVFYPRRTSNPKSSTRPSPITSNRQWAWLDWLPWAEYCYNTSFHLALRVSMFQVVYGRPPLALLPYTANSMRMPMVDNLLQDPNTFLADVRG